MKSSSKIAWIIAILFVCNQPFVAAQTRHAIPDSVMQNITFLGMDFSQAKYIGPPSQHKGVPEFTNDEFRERYTTAWNRLFIDEPKKYNVAKMVLRPSVKYALDVTEKANAGIKKEFSGYSASEFATLDVKKIIDLVSAYDFQGRTGTGLIFFVEGMNKDLREAGAWVTLVDMSTKKVLSTTYATGKSGGWGFRNYWANSWLIIMKKTEADFRNFKN